MVSCPLYSLEFVVAWTFLTSNPIWFFFGELSIVVLGNINFLLEHYKAQIILRLSCLNINDLKSWSYFAFLECYFHPCGHPPEKKSIIGGENQEYREGKPRVISLREFLEIETLVKDWGKQYENLVAACLQSINC